MHRMRMILIAMCSAVFAAAPLAGQTCSCAGAPILSSIEAGATAAGNWLLGVSFEQHAINDVVSGSDELQDASDRERYSNSMLLEASYGLTNRVSLTGMLTMVQHERAVSSPLGVGEDIQTTGLSGGILLMKYTLRRQSPFSSREIAVGGGAKFPLGETDERNRGVLISEDMQPSSGSFDGILWGRVAQALDRGNFTNLYLNGSFQLTSENDRDYDHGNELIATAGVSHSTGGRLGGNLGLRYRWADTATRGDFDLPNTGGSWLYLAPAASVQLPWSLSAQLSGQIPIYRSLDGVQFTTSYSFRASLYWRI